MLETSERRGKSPDGDIHEYIDTHTFRRAARTAQRKAALHEDSPNKRSGAGLGCRSWNITAFGLGN